MRKAEDVLDKINKLLALAGNNPSEEEAKAAMLKAQELMMKYHIENPETIEESDEVISTFFDLGERKKTEIVLMIAGLIARNFRSKMVHSGQKIYFLGMTTDAKAAMQVFVYVLNFADTSYRNFFLINERTKQSAMNWKYGFVVGLANIFNSRQGYELMVSLPKKVLEIVDKLHLENEDVQDSQKYPTQLGGAYYDGFQRGQESMTRREIGAQA